MGKYKIEINKVQFQRENKQPPKPRAKTKLKTERRKPKEK